MKRLLTLALACAATAAIIVPATSAAGTTHHPQRDSQKVTHRDRRSDRSKGTCRTRDGVCGLDTEYLKESMQGDLFEIRGAQFAQKMSSNAAVQRLAAQLIKDHTKSYSDAASLARRLGIKVETDPSPTQQWELQAVEQFKGTQFDHQYSLLEVLDHQQDIDLATHEARDGCSNLVRSSARDELPMLQMHLALAQQALQASP